MVLFFSIQIRQKMYEFYVNNVKCKWFRRLNSGLSVPPVKLILVIQWCFSSVPNTNLSILCKQNQKSRVVVLL